MKSRAFACVLTVTFVVPGIVGTSWASDDVDFMSIAQSAPSEEEYPGADALVLLVDQHVRIDEDGREVMRLQRAVKIFTSRGRRAMSDFRLPFDTDVQRVEVKTARTIRKTLRATDVEKDAINDITPLELQGAAVYSNVLEKVFSYPAALKGSILTLDLERVTTPAETQVFGASVLLRREDPVLRQQFTLAVPNHMPVLCTVVNGDLEPEVDRTEDETIYRWAVSDLPRTIPESNMPPAEDVYPRVVYSTAEDWPQAAREFSEGFFPKAACEGALAEAVEQWTARVETDEERIREVFLHVVEDVRPVQLDLGAGGYEPNRAPQVYHNRYGDCRDKAVLLVAALQGAGIEAYPVLFNHGSVGLVEEVPTLTQFNDVGVMVPGGAETRFLDPGVEYCPYGYHPEGGGNRGLMVKPDGCQVVAIPEYPYDGCFSRKTFRATVEADGSARGEVVCSLGGYFDYKARRFLAEKTASERDMTFSSAAHRVADGARLEELTVTDLADLTTPVAVSLQFSAEGLGLVQGDMMILRIPAFPLPFANPAAYPGLERRTYDFVMDSGFVDTYETELQIPAGYDAVYVPPEYMVENQIGRWEIVSRVDPDQRRITVTRKATVKVKRIPRELYSELKDAFDAFSSPKNGLILLERNAG